MNTAAKIGNRKSKIPPCLCVSVVHPPLLLQQARSGVVLVAALVCLVVASLILGSILKATLLERRLVRQREFELQAQWLAVAGLERAAAQWAADPDYSGEVWSITPQELASRYGGLVTARAEAMSEGPAGQHRIYVQAEYPVGSEYAVRRSESVVIDPTAGD